jgi:hypothetical protein
LMVNYISKFSPIMYGETASCTDAANRLVITHQ